MFVHDGNLCSVYYIKHADLNTPDKISTKAIRNINYFTPHGLAPVYLDQTKPKPTTGS